MFTFKGHWFLLQRAWVPNTSSLFDAQFITVIIIYVTQSYNVENWAHNIYTNVHV